MLMNTCYHFIAFLSLLQLLCMYLHIFPLHKIIKEALLLLLRAHMCMEEGERVVLYVSSVNIININISHPLSLRPPHHRTSSLFPLFMYPCRHCRYAMNEHYAHILIANFHLSFFLFPPHFIIIISPCSFLF
jgi:hypothetical protein